MLGDEEAGATIPGVTPGTPAPADAPAPTRGTPSLLPLRIEMDLLFDADGRPSGSVWAHAAAPQQVLGWLELMSELTRLLSEDRRSSPDSSATEAADGDAHQETRES